MIAILILTVAESNAQTTDSVAVKLFFRVDEAVIDPSYMNNRTSLAAIETDSLTGIVAIAITAASSPEGNRSYNNALAARRADAIKALLQDHFPEAGPSAFRTTVTTNSWSSLRPVLENDRAIPGRGKLLAIMDDPTIKYKEWPVRGLDGGTTYNYLKHHVLVLFRTGEATVTFIPRAIPEPEQPVFERTTEPIPAIVPEISEREMPRRRIQPALKTNLLFDLVGAPNVGVEIPLGKRFSVGADIAYAGWRINNLYALQTIQGGVNAKYWFRPWDGLDDRVLTGWNAGVYATYCSRYDVQWKDGWQGDGFWSVGVSAGYSIPITSRFNMEFVLAAGWFRTPEERHYHRPENGHLMWQQTRRNVGRLSVTKIQANLVWLLKKNTNK